MEKKKSKTRQNLTAVFNWPQPVQAAVGLKWQKMKIIVWDFNRNLTLGFPRLFVQ